jgi:hypothetical protein
MAMPVGCQRAKISATLKARWAAKRKVRVLPPLGRQRNNSNYGLWVIHFQAVSEKWDFKSL